MATYALMAASGPYIGGWAAGLLVPWAFYAGLKLGQRAQSELAEEELRGFKSRLAHEINNPLAVVIEQLRSTVSELEQRGPRERPSELRALADAALAAADRIRGVVGELDDTAQIAPSDEEHVPRRTGPVPARQPRPARILIIDDERSVAVSLRRLLRKHEVFIATTGFDAAALLSEHCFDVVISDVMMPEPSGIDVFERIRRTDPALARRFIFVSGGSFSQRARDVLASIPNPRLAKPVDPEELERAIRAAQHADSLEAVC